MASASTSHNRCHPHSNQPAPRFSQPAFTRPNYPVSLNSTTTHPSALHFRGAPHLYPLPATILTRADLRDSVDTFANMLAAAKAYRSALMALSSATSAFAKSLEDCARLKGAQAAPSFTQSHSDGIGTSSPASGSHGRLHDFFSSAGGLSEMLDVASSQGLDGEWPDKISPGERLMAASGLHFMTANLEQVLSATFYKSFEIPLLDIYDAYRQQLADRQATYEAEVSAKTRAIRETELRNMRQGAARNGRKHGFLGRDLDSFRKGLKELQDQVEAVEKIKQIYYLEVAGGEFEVWKSVAENISLVVKSEVEVYDRVASKATSDPTLEMMVAAIPDPFDTYKETVSSSSQAPEIYSILPPLSSILTPAQVVARKSMANIAQPTYFTPPPLSNDASYPSSSSNDHPSLDSSTHWTTDPPAPLDVPSLSIAHYQSDEPQIEFRSLPTSLFNSPPSQPYPDDDNDRTPRSVPPIALGAPAVPMRTSPVRKPTPLRNVVSLASTSTASTVLNVSVEQQRPDSEPQLTERAASETSVSDSARASPVPESRISSPVAEPETTLLVAESDNSWFAAEPECSSGPDGLAKENMGLLSAIRSPLSSSTKRASVNTIGSTTLLSGMGGAPEDSLMSQLPPSGLDSDSELEGP